MDQNEGETMMPEYILTAKRMEINRLQHEQWENIGETVRFPQATFT